MASSTELKARRRSDYPYMLEYRTRWNDNDMYDHMNNSVYNFLFDSIVNDYLIRHCALHPPTSPQHPLAAHAHTDFFAPISYPAVAELCLRVNRLGRSSVTYEVAVFEKEAAAAAAGAAAAASSGQVCAVGEFVHVFVERATGRPARDGMTGEMRRGLERIWVREGTEGKSAGNSKL